MTEVCSCILFEDISSSDTLCLECGNLKDGEFLETLFSKMRSLPDSCDIEFIVEEERFPAHRIVVAAVSPPFYKLLMGSMKEGASKEIHIREISKTAWRHVLDFIYSGRVSIEKKEDVLAVARFANMYEMDELLCLIEKYMAEHFLDIYKEDGWKLLPFEIVDRIIGFETLKIISELDVLKSILTWAEICSLVGKEDAAQENYENDNSKYDEVRDLLLNVKVEQMEPWEVEIAWNFIFIRDCPETVDAITKRLLSISAEGKDGFGIKPFGCEPVYRFELPWSELRFTFFFKIAVLDTENVFWEKMNSPWMKDDRTCTMWRLQVHLQGKGISTGKHISAYLELHSKNAAAVEGRKKYQIFILNENRIEDPHFEQAFHKFEPGKVRGFRDFIAIDDVFKKGSKYMARKKKSLTFGANLFYDD